MLESIEQVLSLAVAALTLLTALGYFIGRTFKSERAIKYANIIEDVKTHIKEYMTVAENFQDMTGEEKKAWVTEKTQTYLKQTGINISDDLISLLVEELIVFSKQINAK